MIIGYLVNLIRLFYKLIFFEFTHLNLLFILSLFLNRLYFTEVLVHIFGINKFSLFYSILLIFHHDFLFTAKKIFTGSDFSTKVFLK